MNSIIAKLYKWYIKSNASPQMVQIYPTNKCNLRCIFCVQRLGLYNLREEVPKKRWFEIVREICEMGVRKFLISGGGEPLCTPHKTFGIMKIVKSYGAEGRMITNGVLWNSLLIRKTIEMEWNNIMISLHGSNEETHDYLTNVKGTFKKVIKNIELFNFYKKKMRSFLPSIEFTVVLNKHNLKEIPEIVILAHDLEVEGVNVEPICVNNETARKIKLNEEERKMFLRKILPRAEKIAKKLNVRNNFSRIREIHFIEKAGNVRNNILKSIGNSGNFLNSPCYEPWLWPKIEANGEVWPCSTVQIKTTNIKNRSFKEIWYGKEFEEFRKRILRGNLPTECNNCVLSHLPIQRRIRSELKKYLNLKNKKGLIWPC